MYIYVCIYICIYVYVNTYVYIYIILLNPGWLRTGCPLMISHDRVSHVFSRIVVKNWILMDDIPSGNLT